MPRERDRIEKSFLTYFIVLASKSKDSAEEFIERKYIFFYSAFDSRFVSHIRDLVRNNKIIFKNLIKAECNNIFE